MPRHPLRQTTGPLSFWVVCPRILAFGVLLTSSLPNLSAKEFEAKRDRELAQAEETIPPLGRILQRLIQGAPPAEPQSRPDDSEPNSHRNLRSEDRRAPYQVEQAELLERADQKANEQNISAAIELWQEILDQPEDSLVPFPFEKGVVPPTSGKQKRGEPARITWRSPKEIARDRLAHLSPEQLREYTDRYERIAGRLLQEGGEQGVPARYREIAGRYLMTRSGQEAADRLATWHLDRGEYVLAALWLKRLHGLKRFHGVEVSLCDSPAWKLKASWVAKSIEDAAWSETLTTELKQIPPNQLVLGGQTISLDQWPEIQKETPTSKPRSEWKTFYGDATRTAWNASATPSPVTRWSHNLTESEQVSRFVTSFQHSLSERQIPTVCTFNPLIVGERLIVRGWQGVQVHDLRSGKLLWKAVDQKSAEDILLALLQSWTRHNSDSERQFDDPLGWIAQSMGEQTLDGSAGEFSPPGHLLFRDYNYGLISSDQQRLFVIQELPVLLQSTPGNPFTSDGNQLDLFGRDPSCNRLNAYDVSSGRLLWSNGGSAIELLTQTTLSGWFFRGAPLPCDGELLSIAEKQGEIRLFGLNPENGTPLWSQLLGFSENEIASDIARQWISAQPTVAEGIILCPTTTGWIVALDRHSHEVLWYHRSAPSGSIPESQQSFLDIKGLRQGWCQTPVIVSDLSVIYAPPDRDELICLNLIDGTRRWSKQRREGLYVAGIHQQQVILVAQRKIRGQLLRDGSLTWEWEIPHGESVTGRASLSENGLLRIPTSGGLLLTLDTKSGKVVDQQHLASPSALDSPLGNLVLTENELVSVNPLQVRVFETVHSLEVAKTTAPPPESTTPQEVLIEADKLLQQADPLASWNHLQSIPPHKLPSPLRARWETIRRLALMAILRSGSELPNWKSVFEKEFPAEKPVADWELALAAANWMEQHQETLLAWNLLTRLTLTQDLESLFFRQTGPLTHDIRGDLVLASSYLRLWSNAPASLQAQLSERLTESQPLLATAPDETISRWIHLFSFHPQAETWRQLLVQRFTQQGKFHEAEHLLLSTLNDPQLRPQTMEQLSRLMFQAGFPEDAYWYYRQRENEFSGMKLSGEPEGLTTEWMKSISSLSPNGGKLSRTPQWGTQPLQLTIEGGMTSAPQPIEYPLPSDALPSLHRWRIQLSGSQQRLLLRRNSDQKLDWLLPLRTRGLLSELRPGVHLQGHTLTIESGGILQTVSLLDRRLLWTRPLSPDSQSASGNTVDFTDESEGHGIRPTSLHPLMSVSLRQKFPAIHAPASLELVDLSWKQICLRDRRTLTGIDTLTGKTLWKIEGLTAEMLVRGGGELLLILQRQGSDGNLVGHIRSLHDGSAIPGINLEKHLKKTLGLYRGDLIQRSSGTPQAELKKAKIPDSLKLLAEDVLRTQEALAEQNLSSATPATRTTRLQRYNLLTNQILWSVEIPQSTSIGQTSPETCLLIDEPAVKQWRVRQLSLHDGSLRDLGNITPPSSQSLFKRDQRILAYQDASHLYVAINTRIQENYSDDLVSRMNVNGPLAVFDLQEPKLLWQTKVRSLGLILDKLDRSPVLVLTDRRYPLGDVGLWKRDLRVLDKTTGREMLNQQIPSDQQLTSIEIDTSEKTLTLGGEGQILRLRFQAETAQ